MNKYSALKAVAFSALLHFGNASAYVIDFDQANLPTYTSSVGSHVGGSFAGPYTEGGFTVTPEGGPWYGIGNIGVPGRPNSFIYIEREPYGQAVEGVARITHQGHGFNFNSLLMYSSISPVPYVFTGLLGGNVVFTDTGTLPNPEGEFVQVSNSHASDLIDTLEIRLLDIYPDGYGNPIGISQISLTSSVPEPVALSLLGAGLMVFVGQRKLSRRSA
ncbi:hypothetical protein [Aquabacterium sp.]|uniref:hypothetical protein n=1 Tax=Aquabacterium sp. TaxID=1872578 RepID=UPI003D6C88E1